MVSHAGTQNFRTVAPFLHGLVQGFVDEKLMEWDGKGCAGYVVWVGLRRLCGGWVAYYSENNATSWPNLQAELFSFSAELKL